MKQTHVLERDAALERATQLPAWNDEALNLTVVYHDARTQAWAKEVYDRVARLAGPDRVRATWWKISDLVEPGVLAGAVSTAMRADMIVAAIDAGEGLPLPFHVWIDTWLPHRAQANGCLFALVGWSEEMDNHIGRVREYLREVARMGRFEFLLEEHRLPARTNASPRARSRVPANHTAITGARTFVSAARTQ